MKNKLSSILVAGFLMVVLPLSLFAAGKVKKNSKVILSGNILANSQIVPVGGQIKTVMGAGAGKISFSSTRYCGDGDVASYSDSHPTTEFYASDDPDTNIIVGYWISPQGSPLDLSANKFYSIGYVKDSKVDSDVTEKLIATNFSGMPAKKTFKLIEDAVKDLAFVAESTKPARVAGLSNTKFNMKFVAMACPVIKNTNGIDSSSGMNNLTISRQFLSGSSLVGTTNLQDYMQDSILESNASISKTRIRVDNGGGTVSGKSIDLNFGGSGSESLSSELVNLVNDLATRSKPNVHTTTLTAMITSMTSISCSCDRLEYQADLSGLKARFDAFKTRLNAAKADASICDASSSIRFDSADYPWESFRTNAACQLYHKLLATELSPYETALDEMFSAADTNKNTCPDVQAAMSSGSCPAPSVGSLTNISDSEYRSRKMALNKKLMKIVGTPNAIQLAQGRLKTNITSSNPNFALNTASCFPLTAASGEFIKYVGSSVGIDIDPDPVMSGSKMVSINKQSVAHPEGNFAIGGDAPYLTGTGNSLVMFNNTGGDPKLDSSFKVEVGTATPVALTTGTANVQFHIRSIGCSQNIYCYNDR